MSGCSEDRLRSMAKKIHDREVAYVVRTPKKASSDEDQLVKLRTARIFEKKRKAPDMHEAEVAPIADGADDLPNPEEEPCEALVDELDEASKTGFEAVDMRLPAPVTGPVDAAAGLETAQERFERLSKRYGEVAALSLLGLVQEGVEFDPRDGQWKLLDGLVCPPITRPVARPLMGGECPPAQGSPLPDGPGASVQPLGASSQAACVEICSEAGDTPHGRREMCVAASSAGGGGGPWICTAMHMLLGNLVILANPFVLQTYMHVL